MTFNDCYAMFYLYYPQFPGKVWDQITWQTSATWKNASSSMSLPFERFLKTFFQQVLYLPLERASQRNPANGKDNKTLNWNPPYAPLRASGEAVFTIFRPNLGQELRVKMRLWFGTSQPCEGLLRFFPFFSRKFIWSAKSTRFLRVQPFFRLTKCDAHGTLKTWDLESWSISSKRPT